MANSLDPDQARLFVGFRASLALLHCVCFVLFSFFRLSACGYGAMKRLYNAKQTEEIKIKCPAKKTKRRNNAWGKDEISDCAARTDVNHEKTSTKRRKNAPANMQTRQSLRCMPAYEILITIALSSDYTCANVQTQQTLSCWRE